MVTFAAQRCPQCTANVWQPSKKWVYRTGQKLTILLLILDMMLLTDATFQHLFLNDVSTDELIWWFRGLFWIFFFPLLQNERYDCRNTLFRNKFLLVDCTKVRLSWWSLELYLSEKRILFLIVFSIKFSITFITRETSCSLSNTALTAQKSRNPFVWKCARNVWKILKTITNSNLLSAYVNASQDASYTIIHRMLNTHFRYYKKYECQVFYQT